jgi:tRNA(adenine34) deaminase
MSVRAKGLWSEKMSQIPDPGMPQHVLDEIFMRQALRQARFAAEAGEVPVGAVIVHGNQVIARGFNQRETLHDPTAHAEMIAITSAAEHLRSWRLTGCSLYVTLEPCLMCSGAIYLARIDRVIFGAEDPKAGACGSLYDIPADKRLNHQPAITSGVLSAESTQLLRDFFHALRKSAREGLAGNSQDENGGTSEGSQN